MAGNPIAREHRGRLDRLGETEVFARLSFTTVRAFCKELGISPPRLYEWLDSVEGRRDRYEQVKKMKADMWAEEQIDIVDDCDDTSTAAVAKAKARAEARRWIASKLHRQAYGNDAAVNVNVATFAEGHLATLRSSGRMDQAASIEGETQDERDARAWRLLRAGLIKEPGQPVEEPVDADYEIVEEEKPAPPIDNDDGLI